MEQIRFLHTEATVDFFFRFCFSLGGIGICTLELFFGGGNLSPQTRYIVPILDGTEVPKSVLLYFDATTKPKKKRTLCYPKQGDFPCFVLLPNQKFLPAGLQGKHNPQCKRQKYSIQVQLQMQTQVEVQVRKCRDSEQRKAMGNCFHY